MPLPLSSCPWEELKVEALHCRLSQKSKQSPFQCLRLSWDPCPQSVCVLAINTPTAAVLLYFISGQWLGLKTSDPEGPGKALTTPLPPTCREPHRASLGTMLSQKSSYTPVQVPGMKHKKLLPSYLSSGHLCPLLFNSHSKTPGRPFVLEEAIYPFQMYFRKGSVLSQCDPGDPHTTASWMNPTCSLFLTLSLSPSLLSVIRPPSLHGTMAFLSFNS